MISWLNALPRIDRTRRNRHNGAKRVLKTDLYLCHTLMYRQKHEKAHWSCKKQRHESTSTHAQNLCARCHFSCLKIGEDRAAGQHSVRGARRLRERVEATYGPTLISRPTTLWATPVGRSPEVELWTSMGLSLGDLHDTGSSRGSWSLSRSH